MRPLPRGADSVVLRQGPILREAEVVGTRPTDNFATPIGSLETRATGTSGCRRGLLVRTLECQAVSAGCLEE